MKEAMAKDDLLRWESRRFFSKPCWIGKWDVSWRLQDERKILWVWKWKNWNHMKLSWNHHLVIQCAQAIMFKDVQPMSLPFWCPRHIVPLNLTKLKLKLEILNELNMTSLGSIVGMRLRLMLISDIRRKSFIRIKKNFQTQYIVTFRHKSSAGNS